MSEAPTQRGEYASQPREESGRGPEAADAPPTPSEDQIEPAEPAEPPESDDGWVDA